MNDQKTWKNLSSILNSLILTIALIWQIILIFIDKSGLNVTILQYIGYITWIFSVYFGVIPFLVFKKKGDVIEGENYMKTHKLVCTGSYAIIRHPQYLAGILATISITLWVQSFLSIILTIIVITLIYQWTYSEDKILVKKFGKDYMEYKRKVPRLNPFVGIVLYIIRKRKDKSREFS